MIRLPTFSPAAPTKTPPSSFVLLAIKHSPLGPKSPAWRWPRSHARRRSPLYTPRIPLFHRRQIDGALIAHQPHRRLDSVRKGFSLLTRSDTAKMAPSTTDPL